MEDERDLRNMNYSGYNAVIERLYIAICLYTCLSRLEIWDVVLPAIHLYPSPINAVVKKCEETLYCRSCGIVLYHCTY